MAALCSECSPSFQEQSSALREPYDEVSKRLDALAQLTREIDRATDSLAPLVAENVAGEEPWERGHGRDRDSGR